MRIMYRNVLAAALFLSSLLSSAVFASSNVQALGYPGETVVGATNADSIRGSNGSDRIFTGGVLPQRAKSITTYGGADRIVFTETDAIVPDVAGNNNGHIRIRDLIIDNIDLNPEADSISLGRLLGQDNLDATNIGNYLYVLSRSTVRAPGLLRERRPAEQLVQYSRTFVFINVDGDYTNQSRVVFNNAATLDGGYGTDLILEFENFQGSNNFTEITGYDNNTVEQFQALIDMGFLELSRTDVFGSTGGDNLEGTARDERFFSGGVSKGGFGDLGYVIRRGGDDSVRGNGGSDRLIFKANDLIRKGHVRIRDFTIDDKQINSEADSLSIAELIGQENIDANLIGDYLHVVSGLYGYTRTAVFVKLDGGFTAADRAALDTGSRDGADLFLEFQGQQSDNNFETLTGLPDNTSAQFQVLIDWGFFED